MLLSLPPTSNMSHRHIIRSNYFVLICSNLISGTKANYNPVKFGENSVDSVLLPNKCIITLPEMYSVTVTGRKNALQDVIAAGLVLHVQNFASALEKNVVPKTANRLS